MAELTLTKHHGLSNDFLVYQYDGKHRIAPQDVRRICDRIAGFGADGLIIVRPSNGVQDQFDMQLWNSDGTRAEMSGNGIRCAAQALVMAGRSGNTVKFHTDAGYREVKMFTDAETGEPQAEVLMGGAKISHHHETWLDSLRAQYVFVDVGNPHVVVHDQELKYDVEELGKSAQTGVPGGINIELIRIVEDKIEMRVYERGVGVTASCGTGCVASTAAAEDWGLVNASVLVEQPGGLAKVDKRGEDYFLTGPVQYVGKVIIDVPD